MRVELCSGAALCEDELGLELRDRARVIEPALYFAIEFLVAALAAVVLMPVASRRARQLADARARLQAPISERQAVAERDALRPSMRSPRRGWSVA